MSSTNRKPLGLQCLRSPSIPPRDLFDAARERAQLEQMAVARIARRFGFPAATAALLVDLSGIGGARHD